MRNRLRTDSAWSATALVFFALSLATPAAAADHQKFCEDNKEALMSKAASLGKTVEMTKRGDELRVLGGGKTTEFELAGAAPTASGYCGWLLQSDTNVKAVGFAPAPGDQTKTTLVFVELPTMPWSNPLGHQETLVLLGIQANPKGEFTMEDPEKKNLNWPAVVTARQNAMVGNSVVCGLLALVGVGVAYAIAVFALGRVKGGWSFDPVVLTAGAFGKASLSQLQMFGFTLLIVWLLVFVLLRVRVLTDISSDLLLLLGISAAGAGGSKVAGGLKKRLSFENWSWVRNNGWLVSYEQGLNQQRPAHLAKWGDLLLNNGDFDVYSFQLATTSIVVGMGILMSDLSVLAQLKVPPNLLALMGLSNVVYIGGKAVDPNSVGELDESLTQLRQKELGWITAVASATALVSLPADKQAKAIASSPDKYSDYLVSARATARMLQAVYGQDGTKFKTSDIADRDLIPQFP